MTTSLRYPSTDRRASEDRSPDRSAPRPFDLGDVARFTSPLTRMLLASDGLTTTLLESALRTPLRLRVLHQGVGPAAAQDALVRRCLGVGGDEPVLLRRSATADAELTPVSLNSVVALVPDDPALAACVRSARTPIGYGLRAAGAMRVRRLVEVGVAGWERDGRVLPAVFKSYVVLDGELPWLFIRELFNPLLIPAGRDSGGRGSPVGGRAHPLEAVPDTGASSGRAPREQVGGGTRPLTVRTPEPAPVSASAPTPISTPAAAPGTSSTPASAAAPGTTNEAFWLQFGGQATGALLAAAAGLVRYATGAPVTVVTGDHPAPGRFPREARWIAKEYGAANGSAAPWLGDFPQMMAFLDDCPPAVADRVQWAADGRTPSPGTAVGLPVRPGCRPREVAARCAALNPGREPGRLVLSVRLAPERILAELPALIEAVAATDTPVTWVCAPRPGGATAAAEVATFFDTHYSMGSRPGGLLLDDPGCGHAEALRTVHAAATAWQPAP